MKKYEVNQIVKGTVTGIEKYGVFLNIDDNYTGLIHISEISSSFVKNISDYVFIEEKIKAKIIGIDEEKNQLKLSIKGIRDYRYMKRRTNKIEETPSGFSTLAKKMPIWIKEKQK